MRVLVTGANGQLGFDVVRELQKRGYEAVSTGTTEEPCSRIREITSCGNTVEKEAENGDAKHIKPYRKMDITVEATVRRVLSEVRPDAVIHCASWTAVDAAEDKENEAKVYAVNKTGTEYIAKMCKELDCKLIYISTEYVFDGQGEAPWQPDGRGLLPLNVYGRTKLAGESVVAQTLEKYFIVRISWAFGINGNNFVKTMVNVGKNCKEVRVVNDQIGTPTYTPDIARLLVDMCETEKYGCYHATNEGGYISRYDFCVEIYRQYGLSTRVIPVTSEEYGLSKAARPKNGRLDTGKLARKGFTLLPPWQDAVGRYLKELLHPACR